MKKFLWIFIFIVWSGTIAAQQTESYSQYIFNAYALNPAVGGIKECIDIKAGFREQWLGFQDAPWTAFVSIHKSFGRDKGYKKGWHGVGGYIFNDNVGLYDTKAIYPSYSYHLRLGRNLIGAAGFFAGIRQQSFKGIQGSPDPVLASGSAYILPEIVPGIWIYSSSFYGGLSVRQVYKNKMSGIGGQVGGPSKLPPHFYLTLGKVIKAENYYYTYYPSLLVKYTPLYPPSIDLNFMMFIKDKIGYGLGWRNTDGFIGLVQVRVLKSVAIGYSFDFVTSKVRNASFQSHEIIISFDPCGGPTEDGSNHCPAYH